MISQQLLNIAKKLGEIDEFNHRGVTNLIKEAEKVGKCWSGSWIGYQSCVYYKDFQVPPSGASFSQEWGLTMIHTNGTKSNWREYSFDDVVQLIEEEAGSPYLNGIEKKSLQIAELFDEVLSSALSIIHARVDINSDRFLDGLIKQIENAKLLDVEDFIKIWKPKNIIPTRDQRAVEQGLIAPPHYYVLAKMNYIMFPWSACKELYKLIIKLANHMKNIETPILKENQTDKTKVFLVHGHDNEAKLEVARFIEKIGFSPIILHEQVSGSKTIIEKIEAFSDVGFGVVIYTPCDIGAKNTTPPELNGRARQNVVFEHGFLIGKLGRENVCTLVKGDVETPNDISGVVYTSMNNSPWQLELAKELHSAGYVVDMNKAFFDLY